MAQPTTSLQEEPIRGGFRFDSQELPSPLGTVRATALHAVLHLQRMAGPRTLWPYLLIIVAVIAGGLGLARLSLREPDVIVRYVGQFALRALALVALGLGTGAIRHDAEVGALTAFLLRPRAEVALPVGRWLAVTALVTGLGWAMAAGVLASVAGTVLMPAPAWIARLVLAIALGSAAYSAIFLAIASFVRSAAAVGLAWMVAADLVLAARVDTIGVLSPSHWLGRLVERPPDVGLLGADLAQAVLGLMALTAAALAAAVWRFRRDPLLG